MSTIVYSIELHLYKCNDLQVIIMKQNINFQPASKFIFLVSKKLSCSKLFVL